MRTVLTFISITLLVSISAELRSQPSASSDGVEIMPSVMNDSEVFFGEPINIYFEVRNKKPTPNPYYHLAPGVNARVYLVNTTTNDTISDKRGLWKLSNLRALRMEWQSTLPPPNKQLEAKEILTYSIDINDSFGQTPLQSGLLNGGPNHLLNRLIAVEEGDYRIVFEYYLFPKQTVLKCSFDFKVLEVPDSMQDAFQAYVKAVNYAGKHHFYYDGGYDKGHPDSFENFMESYPNSVYAQYAFMDLANEIYSYPNVDQSHRKQFLENYLDYFPKISRKNQQVSYGYHLPKKVEILQSLSRGVDSYVVLDRFLKNVENRPPVISRQLILKATAGTDPGSRVKQLRNYAQERVDKEQKE